MTKYEWERQLKKGISGLPKAEQQRVLDYYNELFADKIDAGLREQYIISEFGNPYDVANKILVDYYNGDKENPEVDAYIYADSDEIDAAFEEEPVKTVETPKRKTWTERREERHTEQRLHHEERRENIERGMIVDNFSDDIENDAKDNKANSSKGVRSASGLIVLLCILTYCVLGACFGLWGKAWLIFLAIPCVITLIEAINKRNWKIFAYPVLATLIFLLLGYEMGAWHPGWIIFITIPIYYVLGDFITKNTDGSKRNDKPEKPNKKENKSERGDEKVYAPVEVNKKAKKTEGKTNVVALIAKILMAICLVCVAVAVCWWVIGLFVSGIGMIIGGIACIVGAALSPTANLLIAGIGIAVLGLGLMFTFGMAALFKPCFKMCKSFVNTIKKSFDKEVA